MQQDFILVTDLCLTVYYGCEEKGKEPIILFWWINSEIKVYNGKEVVITVSLTEREKRRWRGSGEKEREKKKEILGDACSSFKSSLL